MVVWDLYYSSHRYKPKLKHLKLMDTSVGLCTQRWPWVNPTQPNPWVDPTHGHLCVYSLQPVSGSRPGHGCGTSINSAYAYVSWSPQPDTTRSAEAARPQINEQCMAWYVHLLLSFRLYSWTKSAVMALLSLHWYTAAAYETAEFVSD